ncbi:Majin [Phodopus roborovskii]|uniref:Majin protein n=1 Tax=Phodopus roborovskii TaxID=109678 RepID=A0AAU9ZLV6_PHORO|nr:Majin [Phodopus roborovskii]
MSLKPFTYPFPETRFLHAGPSVYKFKIRYGDSIRGEEIENKEVIIQELENREGEAQQEHQDASDATDGQEQDSKLGHSLPGLVVPPLQHSNPSPPREPGTSGFFGFLSTLFPFRYFFRKSSQ